MATRPDSPALSFAAGGGEMGERLRAFDWSATPLGPIERWPQSLRSAVSFLLPSRAQIVLFWGRDFSTIYNDAYRPVFGAKHPSALGLPARESWSEIWKSQLRDLLEGVRSTGEAYWASDLAFFVIRHGYLEETYFDVSYDPVRDESGDVGGVLCIVTETTPRVLSERRLRTLRDLSAGPVAEVRSVEEACRTAAGILAEHSADLPFALIYLIEADGRTARLSGSAGLAKGSVAAPSRIELNRGDDTGGWPLDAALRTRRPQVVTDLAERFGPLPGGTWPEPTHSAVVLPIARSGQDHLAGFLVAGVSPRRAYDDAYRDFLKLVGSQVATAIANARAYEEERRRAEELAALDRAKTAFFHNVSHEFRTPLTLMLGPVEDLLAGAARTSPVLTRSLEVVHRNGLRLLRLVNTLLDFSRIEAGRVRAAYRPIDLAAFTADLASNFRSACERAGLELVVDCRAPIEPVFVDLDMWEKIVLNLLSNAFKFTLEGRIAVSLHQLGDAVELVVRDTGTGIPAEEMPRLFERFHRVHSARGRTHEGSGIGLALVYELVRLHGGSIAAESEVDKGTKFTVSIPLGSAHLPPDQIGDAPTDLAAGAGGAGPYLEEALRWLPDAARSADDVAELAIFPSLPEARRDPGPPDERPRVLIADDNADMRQYVARLLASRFRVETVTDGEAALAAARARRPDLVLADVMMPRLDGFGLLRALRADPALGDIPLVMLSARAGEDARIEGVEAGADDYLTKPFSARELVARIDAAVRMAAARRMEREADRRKDEFLAILAHELRNPLAPIQNALTLLAHASGDGTSFEEMREMMQRQVAQMVRLVDDLLDVSRISRGTLELRRERIELAPIVDQAIETSRPLLDAAQHEVTVSLPPDPVHLDADPLRLGQVFSNLLNNACKFTPSGGRIWIRAERYGDEVVVSVRDSGIGIQPAEIESIFGMFEQVDKTLERSQEGLGIGLTLSKHLVELHGGRIAANSEGLGRGSEFVVRLPALAAAEKPTPVPDKSAIAATSNLRRILVVDDNEDAADSLARLLELMGNETYTANDGQDAIEMAERLRPHVVLLDIGMPKMNGYEACRRIRALPEGRAMFVVALTGWGQDDDRRKSGEAGFDGHLVKPVDLDEFLKLVESGAGMIMGEMT